MCYNLIWVVDTQWFDFDDSYVAERVVTLHKHIPIYTGISRMYLIYATVTERINVLRLYLQHVMWNVMSATLNVRYARSYFLL